MLPFLFQNRSPLHSDSEDSFPVVNVSRHPQISQEVSSSVMNIDEPSPSRHLQSSRPASSSPVVIDVDPFPVIEIEGLSPVNECYSDMEDDILQTVMSISRKTAEKEAVTRRSSNGHGSEDKIIIGYACSGGSRGMVCSNLSYPNPMGPTPVLICEMQLLCCNRTECTSSICDPWPWPPSMCNIHFNNKYYGYGLVRKRGLAANFSHTFHIARTKLCLHEL